MTRVLKAKRWIVLGGAMLMAAMVAPYSDDCCKSGVLMSANAAERHDGSSHDGHSGKLGRQGVGGQQKGTGGHEAASGGASKTTESVLSGDEGGGKGAMHEGGSTHDQGQHDSNKQQGVGQGGPGEDSDAKGPRHSAGQGDEAHGGKPVWAQEGIPEVELGRLNLARAPGKVLDQALTTALATLSSTPALYQLPTLAAVISAINAGTLPDGATIVRIDSPRENLALYKDVLQDGRIVLPDGTTFVTSLSAADLAAIFLGAAADKNLKIEADTVKAMDTILDVSLPAGTTEAALAAAADDVREAILAAHE